MSSRIAFVTGASRGIGRACALALSAAGHKVALAARDAEKLESLAEEIRGKGGEVFVSPIDLSSQESIQSSFARTAKEFGPVTILVNNAGITKDTLALRMKREDWDAVLQTNLTGSFLCIQQVLQGMMKERWGRIINIASVVGEMGNAGQANYVSSKAGLIGLTKSLALELGGRNITVNAVTPGFVETDMTAGLNQDLRERMKGMVALKRFALPEEIAGPVVFLASEQSSYMTGSVLKVNGGMYM
jgi:3-oxoacyl-[acyl-carrier protein] reductase